LRSAHLHQEPGEPHRGHGWMMIARQPRPC
jgi:hypothetical protein